MKIAIENLDKAIYLGENNDITNRANAYMLPLVTEPTQFLVSAKRVDDYWNGDWTTHYASGSGNIFRGDTT